MRTALLAGALALIAPVSAMAAEPSLTAWAQAFPDPARVNADIAAQGRGDDPLIVAARQRGTLYQLYDALSRLSGSMTNDPDDKMLVGHKPPRSVTAKRRAYWDAIQANQARWYPQLEKQTTAPCDGKPRSLCKRARYMDTSGTLQYSEDAARGIAQRYFPLAMRDSYVGATRSPPATPRPPRPEAVAPRKTLADWLWIILMPIAVLGFLMLLFRRKPSGAKSPTATSGNYGTADWAAIQTEPPKHSASGRGVFLGQSSAPPIAIPGGGSIQSGGGAPIYTEPSRHTLIVAPTRTGKGTGVIVPTLLRHRASLVVIDPKGENAAITARNRRDALGQKVHIVNPWKVISGVYEQRGFLPARFNPLDILDRNDPRIVSRADALAGAIVPVLEGTGGAVWEGTARDLLSGIFLWLTDQPGEKKTLARVKELIGMSRSAFRDKHLVNMAASTAFSGAIAEKVSQYLDMADETYSGVIFNLSNATNFMSDPLLKEATAASDFSMLDLTETPTTVYIVIPPDMVRPQAAWLRLMIGALTAAYKEFHDRAGIMGVIRKPQRAMMLIDELPALGKLADLPTDIAVMAGQGIDYTLIVQGLGQLNAIYGPHAAAIKDNCAFKWFCNVGDLDTARYLSEALGDKTVATKSTSTSTSSGPGGDSSSSSTSSGEMGRRLLKPEEIMQLGPEVAISLQPKGRPLYLTPVDYWKLDAAFGKWRNTHPDLLWAPPMRIDPNPFYNPDEDEEDDGGKHEQQKGQGDQKRKGEGAKKESPPPRSHDGMTREKALDILGFKPNAQPKPEEIKAAYLKRVNEVHPDRPGGSGELTKMVNAAKDYLTGKKS